MTRVVNVRAEACDVYIGRGSEWGNRYSHRPSRFADVVQVATREEAIERYRRDLWERIKRDDVELIYALDLLHGQTLGCYCKPASCHGDVLARAAGWAADEVRRREECGA